jgi:3-oxoadipate enol-lactonase
VSIPTLVLTAVTGPADAPLLVLGPSLGTSTILWDDVIPLISGHVRVTAWDLPGHGESPPVRERFSVADLADAVAAAIPDEQFLYAGVSLGGATGLELALRHPHRVRAAAIIASGARLGDPSAWRERAEQARTQSTSSLIIASAQRWFADGSIKRRPGSSGRLLHVLQDVDDESYARCCEALAEYDVRDMLDRITAPLLAMYGERDAVAPGSQSMEIASGVRAGTALAIADAAHLPPAEQPQIVAAALLDFFGETGGATHDPTRW